MKKLLTVCMMLAALSMIAFAGPKTETIDVLKYEPLNSSELKMAIQLLEDQIAATKNAGLESDPSLNARLEEFQLRLNPEERADANPLDQGGGDCASALVIASAPYADTGVLDGTDDRAGIPYFDVFYTYTAAAAGSHTADMCGSAGDTYLRVWTAGTCGTGASSTNDDGCGGSDPTLTLSFAVSQVLYFECGYYYSTGGTGSAYNFNLSAPTPPPVNDQCGGALPLVVPGSNVGTTAFATNDYDSGVFGAGCPVTSTAKDVVYTYTPIATELVTLDLCGSGYDTKVYVATSCPPTAMTMVACDDDGCPGSTWRSILTCVPLTGGVTYYIFVDGYGTANGAFDLVTSTCAAQARCCYTNTDGSSGCQNVTAEDCALLGGVFTATATCESAPCAEGSCCYVVNGDICHRQCAAPVTPDFCATLGGVYTEGGDCSTPCPVSACEYCSCTPNTHSAAGPVAIPDNGCTTFLYADLLINVPVEYHITDVNVSFDITHTWDSDVQVYLISPLGTQVELTSGNGSSGDNYHCTVLDDEATMLVTAGIAPFTGFYVPEFALSAFDGENALGNWTLRVCDAVGSDLGTINWACLSFEYDYILPVTGVAFDAVAGNNSITLNWSTASESNMSRFEVLRGANKVAEVACTNSSTTHNYSFVDNDVTNGVAYSYTLVGVAIDGSRGELASVNASPNANGAVVTEYALLQNFPNPFNPETNIAFDMVEAGHVNVSIYNVIGQKVAELVNGNMNAGRHIVSFDATNLPSGLYLYKMEANGFSAQKKMVLMK